MSPEEGLRKSPKCWRDQERIRRELARLFGKSQAEASLRGKVPYICGGRFMEAYLVSGDFLRIIEKIEASGRYPYSAGIYVGRLRRRKPTLIPSADFLTYLYSVLGRPLRALTVSESGLKPFLYGNDILKASIIRCHPPIDEGEVVGVLGRDNVVYGVGLSKIASCREIQGLKPTDPVALNVFDVGWYVRGGTTLKERKFKLQG